MDTNSKQDKALKRSRLIASLQTNSLSSRGARIKTAAAFACFFALFSTTAFAQAPIATDQSANVDEGASVGITLDVTLDPGGGAPTYTITDAPDNGSLSGTAPNLTYNHDGSNTTSDSFSYQVCDPEPLCDTATVTITVNPVSDGGPTATDQTTAAVSEGGSLPIALDVTPDPDGGVLTYTITDAPDNGSLSGTAPNLTYNHDGSNTTSDSFSYQVCDPEPLCDTATVTIPVNPVSDGGPTATNQSANVNEGGAVGITLNVTPDPDGGALTYTITNAPNNGSLSGTAPNLTYNHDGSNTTSDSFSYQVCDPEPLCDTATVSITVNPQSDGGPTATNQSANVNEGGAVGITLNVTPDPDGGALTYTITDAPNNGSLSGTAPNLTYNHDGSNTTSDSFSYQVCDPEPLCDTATVSITVNPQSDGGPTATNQSANVNEGSAVGITLNVTPDPDGGALTYTITDAPNNGSLSGTAPNLTYNHDGSNTTSDSFSYQVCDPEPLCDTATVAISVNPQSDGGPTATNQSANVNEGGAVGITLNVTPDPDGGALTYTITDAPNNGSLSGTAPNLTYNHDGSETTSDSFSYQVCDPEPLCDTATVAITVNPQSDGGPTATNQSANVNEGGAVGITLNVTPDPDGGALTYTITNAPNNGSLSGTAPNLTYNHDGSNTTSDSFSYQVCDPEPLCDTATVSITVNPQSDGGPTATNQSANVNEGGAVGITLNVTPDPDGGALTYTITDAPNNGSLSGTAPSLTYNHDGSETTSDSFSYQVCDPEPLCDTATVVISVNPQSDGGPTATNQSANVNEGGAVGITLNVTPDPDGGALTYTITDAPNNGSLSGTAPNLTYNHDGSETTSDSFSYQVCDPEPLCDTATVAISVNPQSDGGPTATNQSANVNEGGAVGITLNVTPDPDGGALTYTITDAPNNGSLSGTAPNLTYNHDGSETTSDSFSYQVCDPEPLCDTATVAISVNPVSDGGPTATNQSANVNEGASVGITLNVTPDPDGGVLTYTITSAPSNGSLSGTAPNLTYTHDGTETTSDSFSYQVCDPEPLCDTATVTITVNPVNEAPVADDQPAITVEDVDLPITLTGSDPDGDALTFAIVAQPRNGTLSGTAPDLTYSPDENFNGVDSFTFTVSDSEFTSPAATVAITVNAANDIPTADPQSVTTDEDIQLPITLTGSDPENDPLTFAIVVQPINGTLDCTGADCTYTPNANYNGPDSFTFTASDGEFTSLAATVTITVIAVNDRPVADAQTVETPEDTALPITLTALDAEDDVLAFAVVVQPVNGTLSGTAPDLTYSPNADFNGTDSFTFTASDAELTSLPATISITVTALNDEPVVSVPIPTQVAIERSLFNLDVSGNFTDADNDPLQFTASGLPVSGNLVFDPLTGVFSGTPTVNDARDNDPYIVIVTATDNQPGTTPVQTQFDLNISALDRANVSLEISVAPDPAMLNDELQWTFTASNALGPQPVANVELTGSIIGDGLTISSAGSCTIGAATGQVRTFECALGSLPIGGTSSVVFSALTSTPGGVVVFASAASTDPVPIDPNIDDNSSEASVGVAAAFSNGAVQVLGTGDVRSLAAGDVNGDGAADLVVGTAAGQPIQVYLSSGFRDFAAAPLSLPDTSANEGIALADFDGNGTLDLVVANGDGAADAVYSNDGAGNFALSATLGVSIARDVAVGDFNDDNIADIVIAAAQGNPVYLGDGIGGFTADAPLGNADSHALAVADLNGDGQDDVVFANMGTNSQVWLKNAAAGFSPGNLALVGDAVSVAVGQFGGSAALDLAFGRVYGGAGDVAANPVFLNDGAGGFASPLASLGTSATAKVLAGDVNRDGLTDLVFVNLSGVHQVWTSTGSGFVLYAEQIADLGSTVGILSDLGLADVGDPGGVDLAMGGAPLSGLGVFLNDGLGNLGRGDAVPPVLALLGEASVSVPANSNYNDAGATAEDNIDGDITGAVVMSSNVNTSVVGNYTVTYNVTDFAGNNATPITRTVSVAPAAGTGGGGGGMLSELLLYMLLLAACLSAYGTKRAIIPSDGWKQN